MNAPEPVTAEMLRAIIDQFSFKPGSDIEWSWLSGAADRITALEARNRALEAIAAYLAEALAESGCVEEEDEPWLNLVSRDWTCDDVPTREALDD